MGVQHYACFLLKFSITYLASSIEFGIYLSIFQFWTSWLPKWSFICQHLSFCLLIACS